jgi:hypothetical protein
MKNKLTFLTLLILTVVFSPISPLQAQSLATTNTNTPPPVDNPQTFFGTVGNYLTTSNPNLPIRGRAEIALGMAYQSGVNIASDFSARYKLSVTTNSDSGVLLESVTRNAGINGVIVSEQAGLGYYYLPSTTPDIELSAGLLGGYRFDTRSAAFTAYLDARKSLTPNTFAGLRIAFEHDGSGSPNAPVLTAYTGFTF